MRYEFLEWLSNCWFLKKVASRLFNDDVDNWQYGVEWLDYGEQLIGEGVKGKGRDLI
jgi:hypothetical protein